MTPLLEVSNLSVELGIFSLRNVSFQVDEGTYCCVIGASGAGKSVLLETIAGGFVPSSGKVFLNDVDITSWPPEKRKLSIVYQDYMLFPHLSVFENIAFGLRNQRMPHSDIRTQVYSMAKMLQIEPLLQRNVTTLSGGEQQRIALARALVIRPQILLLDEAFSALDIVTRERMRKCIKALVKELGVTVLHVTHDMEDVWTLATHVVVIQNGCLSQIGRPDDIFQKPQSFHVACLVGAKNIFEGGGCDTLEGEPYAIDVDGVFIRTTDYVKPNERVALSIRPEEIIVATEPFYSSARNVLKVKVDEVSLRGPLVWIRTQWNSTFIYTVVTRSAFDELHLREGGHCFLMFKARSVRVLSHL